MMKEENYEQKLEVEEQEHKTMKTERRSKRVFKNFNAKIYLW